MPDQIPLIVTLQIDQAAFNFFNDLRKKHFPPAINYLDAHLTLFHHLPDNPEVPKLLAALAEKQNTFILDVPEVIKLGRGVAYKLKSEALMHLHTYLKHQWQQWLTPQDKQGFRPHITVQNKVDPVVANTLFLKLQASFIPFQVTGTGFSLWEYHGGPWKKRQDFAFGSAVV